MKTIEEIYQELAEEFRLRTGLTAGGNGDLSVRFYAVAAQLYGLYTQAEWTQRQCFPQTADGEALDHHAGLRSVSRREASKASGMIRFVASANRLEEARIPMGTVCLAGDGMRYLTTREAVIPLGETVADVPAVAEKAGAAQNVVAGRILYLTVPPAGVLSCSNPDAFTGGGDEEDDESLRARVLATYTRLANGANSAFYEQAAASCDGVAAVKVLPRNRGVGTVDVVIAAHGGMPGQPLLEQVQAYLNGIREIAVDVQAVPPAAAEVALSVTVTPEEGTDFAEVSARVTAAVEEWFTGNLLGRAVHQAALTALVFGVEGVANCTVALAGGDVAADPVTLPYLGSLTVTEG